MTTRVNLCTNPAAKNNVTGWGGASTPTRATTLTGFDRATGAHYTSGTYAITAGTANGAITPGQTYTASLYIRSNVFNQSGRTLYLEWLNSGGGVISDAGTSFSLSFGVVSRVSGTGVAPANAAALRLVIDGINFGVSDCDVTMVLIEQSATVGDYFDGDTSGAAWDGTDGNSSSTWSDTPSAVTGDIDGTLPALTGALTADVLDVGTVAGTLPTFGGSLAASVTADGDLAGTLPALTGTLSGDVQDQGTLAGDLPALGGTVTGEVFDAATLTGVLPAVTGDVSAAVVNPGTVDANLPELTGDLAGTVVNPATLAGTLPALTGSLSSGTPDEATLAGSLPALTGSLAGEVVADATLAGALPALTGSFTGGAPGVVEAIRVDVSGPAVAGLVDGPVLAVGAEPSGPAARRDVSGPAVRRIVDGVGV